MGVTASYSDSWPILDSQTVQTIAPLSGFLPMPIRPLKCAPSPSQLSKTLYYLIDNILRLMLSIVKLDVKKKQGVADETQGTSQDVPGFPPVFHTPSNIPTQAKGRLEWATRHSPAGHARVIVTSISSPLSDNFAPPFWVALASNRSASSSWRRYDSCAAMASAMRGEAE